MTTNNTSSTFKSLTIHSLYSQIAGVAALLSTNFLEVTKIRMISDVMNCSVPHYKEKTLYSLIKNKHSVLELKNLKKKCIDCLPLRNSFLTLYHILITEGFYSMFFRGIDKTLFSHLIRTGMFYPLFELIKFRIRPLFSEKNKEVYSSTVGSGLARSIVTVVSFPFEILKIMAQSGDQNVYRASMLNTIRELIRKRSNYSIVLLNFFQREIFFSLIFWYLFEKRRAYLKAHDTNHSLSELRVKINSAFWGGFVASIMTFPYDIVQTNKIIHEKLKNTNSLRLLIWLKNTYGWSILTNGLFVRTTKGCLTTGIFFTLYEFLKEVTNHNEYN